MGFLEIPMQPRPDYYDYHKRERRRKRRNMWKLIGWFVGGFIVLIVIINLLDTEDTPYGNKYFAGATR
jgi:hypothetical protein